MTYTINPNAKDVWIRDNEDTMDLSPITDATSVYLENGRTLEQELGEGAMVSNVATVDSAMSKVIDGTLDGAYESCVFKGRTLVNLVSQTSLENSHFTDYTLSYIDKTRTYLIKYESSKPISNIGFIVDNTTWNKRVDITETKTNGYVTIKPNESLDVTNLRVVTSNSIDSYTLKIMLLEYQEGMEDWNIPYFEGICDVKMPILRNTGKNLFDMSMVETNSRTRSQWNTVISENSIRSTRWGDTTNGEFGAFIRIDNVKPSTTYTLTYEPYINNVYSNVHAYIYNNSTIWGESLTAGGNGTIKFTTKSNTEYITIGLNYGICSLNTVYETRNIQLEESPTSTTYEPHKTNILRTSEEIVLREVNGVQDTYNPLTGEYVQRIGEIILDGSDNETWGNYEVKGDNVKFAYYPTFVAQGTYQFVECLCDKWKAGSQANETIQEQISLYNHMPNGTPQTEVRITVSPTRLQSVDVTGFRAWLSQNPLTVQYILAEPVTTIVEPSTIPFAYENGHVILESGYEGQSLLPALEYSTMVNKTGQIKNIGNTILRQEKQLTTMEKMLIQNIIDLGYNNALTKIKLAIEEVK